MWTIVSRSEEIMNDQAQMPQPWKDTKVVGRAMPRIDAYERVSGSAVFPTDVVLPDMLYAVVLRCPHAHARVTSVDTSKAETMPGVRAIITDATPEAKIGWYQSREKPLSRLFDPDCRYAGEEVAALAAETPYQAWDAARAIRVDYDVLPFVVTEEDALKPGAPSVHGGANRVGDVQVTERGNVTAGFAAADVVLEQTYRTPCEIHTTSEPHGSVARWDGSRLTVWDSTQGVFWIQSALAASLSLPIANVRVIGHYVGGGFGSKIDLSKHTVIATLLARKTARPVKLVLTREETLVAVGNRPANTMTIKAGAKKDGTLTALHLRTVGSGGAYLGDGVGGVDWQVRDLYRCPNVRTEATDVFINAGPARAFRAPGHPQCAWALEQTMDALADRLNMDPVEFRLKNVPSVSQATDGQPPYSSTGLEECLTEGAAAFGWKEARARAKDPGPIRRGVGVAAGLWQGGGAWPPATVIVKLFADGSVNLNMGAADLGTGTKTVMAMVVAEELGIGLDRIQIEHADTATTQYTNPSGGSKTVPTEAPAVREAAIAVKRELLALAGEQLKLPADQLSITDGNVVSVADPAKKLAIRELGGLERRGVIMGVASRGPDPEGKVICPFAAHFAEVEVNARTGEVRLTRFLAAQDSGRVMNRLTYENQVFGGITMGTGLALTEERVLDRARTGRMVNANWHDYKIPTALDVPADQTCLPIDPHDTGCNSVGAKGLGEPATIPTAAAIANAVGHAIGVRLTDAPMTRRRVLEALRQASR
jgi:CO/xanthine dehydrogenase Mo-binding subunit